MALHHTGTEEELDEYFEKVKRVVLAEKEVFGEFPLSTMAATRSWHAIYRMHQGMVWSTGIPQC